MGIKKSKGYDHLTNLGLKPGEIDMHMHSTASDGTDSPGQLALKAREAELTFFAITDHDTYDGCAEAEKALAELKRVTKPGGTIIIPTYINMSKGSGTAAVKFIELLGANFKRQFDLESYKQFFTDMGYSDVTYEVVDGRMPCALAVIKN